MLFEAKTMISKETVDTLEIVFLISLHYASSSSALAEAILNKNTRGGYS